LHFEGPSKAFTSGWRKQEQKPDLAAAGIEIQAESLNISTAEDVQRFLCREGTGRGG
jgi:hypothetical protein